MEKMAELYDTGLIDSRKVQEKYGILFRGIMERLKTQLFTNYKNPFLSSFNEAEKACLKDMESIYLVVHDTEKGFRLSQACDVSNILPNSWNEQTEGKGDIQCEMLYRSTSTEERDNYTLGVGQFKWWSKIKENISIETLSSSFWSCSNNILHGYGAGVQTETFVEDIVKIADVDRNHTIGQGKFGGGVDSPEGYNKALWEAILRDTGVDDDYDIESYVNEQYGEGNNEDLDSEFSLIFYLYDYLHDYVKENIDSDLSDEQMDEVLKKRGIDIDKIKLALDRDKRKENYDYNFDAPEGFDAVKYVKEYLWTADGALELLREINFIYHPWVTVAEIQAHRVYNPPAASSKSKTKLVMKLKF